MRSIGRAKNVKRITPIPQRTRYRWSRPGWWMPRTGAMTTRRKIIWWFKFVLSGRFLETFLNLRSRRS